MKKFLKIFLRFFPVLLMGVILIVSSYMFHLNRKQTYERVRNLKESQVQIISSQVDLGTKLDPNYTRNEDNIKLIKKSIENINEQVGVYCYLFSKDCQLISDFSKTQKHVTGEAIIQALKENNIEILLTEEYHGYISTTPSTGEKFLIYWQGLPSGNRDSCDFFIVLAVSENEIQENEAISSCKIMISILTILLGISLYGNLYIKPYFVDEGNNTKDNTEHKK